jgi:hypothetical protein
MWNFIRLLGPEHTIVGVRRERRKIEYGRGSERRM